MKLKHNTVFLLIIFNSINLLSQSLQFKVYGLYNKTIEEKIVDANNGVRLGGFDPKYGYQFGILYQQRLFKSFVINGEIGFLNKGNNVHDSYPSTRKLYDVNYNYLYLKPSIGYKWHNLTLSVGTFFNFLQNEAEIKKKTFPGTISKTDIAYNFELSYQYQRWSLFISNNESINPMQELLSGGNTFAHYHHWYAVGLSYAIFNKK
jgi:hypothetical protein